MLILQGKVGDVIRISCGCGASCDVAFFGATRSDGRRAKMGFDADDRMSISRPKPGTCVKRRKMGRKGRIDRHVPLAAQRSLFSSQELSSAGFFYDPKKSRRKKS